MGLKFYKHRETGEVKRSLSKLDPTTWEEQLSAPNQKFMVTANAGTGTSKVKDSTAILTERARNHSREHGADETIQLNTANGLGATVKQNLLNEKGERRKKIDDL